MNCSFETIQLKCRMLMLCFLLVFSLQCYAQLETEIVADSVLIEQEIQELSPMHKKAFKTAWHSAVLPSWGQFNNNQKWKTGVYVPIIMGGISYGVANNRTFKRYNNALNSRAKGNNTDEFWGELSDFELKQYANRFKNKRKLGYALAGGTYAIQIMDAYVYSVINQKGKSHSPARAAFLSAVVPGLGQVYNKKYWKLPIVYGALGVSAYFIQRNAVKHKAFKEAYINYDVDGFEPDPITVGFTQSGLLNGRKVYQRNLEVSSIIAGVLYVANILDAVVDAHLFDFDVSDELSISAYPMLNTNGVGGSFSLRF